ncbi:MAG: EamA family transporter [Lentisphaerae bacterium]|nr:EamA family transporter [Lentisphaerota bacterium]
MGVVHVIAVVLALTTVSWSAKLASRRGVSALDLSLVLFLVSTLFSAIWVALQHGGPPPDLLAGGVLAIAAVAGAGGGLAVLAFNHALRLGHFGFSNAIYRSAFLIPVVAGVLWFNAPLRATTALGIALVLLGMVLMSWSADSFRAGERQAWRWFLTITAAFLLSGLPRLGQLLTSSRGLDYGTYLLLSYLAGFAVLLVAALWQHRRPPPAAVGYGAVAGLASYAGVYCTLEALERLRPTVVFPVTLSGPIVMGLILSLVVFRERLRLSGWLGIGAAVAGMIVLGLWR